MPSLVKTYVNKKDLDLLMDNFQKKTKDIVRKHTLGEIQIAFQRELKRQLRENPKQRLWKPLAKDYRERKERDFAKRSNGVRYDITLMRTGKMIEGYLNNIKVGQSSYSVSLNLPRGSERLRAEVHQGLRAAPKGVTPRPWDLEAFRNVANDTFGESMGKWLDKEFKRLKNARYRPTDKQRRKQVID